MAEDMNLEKLNDSDLENVTGGVTTRHRHGQPAPVQRQDPSQMPENWHYCHDIRCSMYNVYQDIQSHGYCSACGQELHPFENR